MDKIPQFSEPLDVPTDAGAAQPLRLLLLDGESRDPAFDMRR